MNATPSASSITKTAGCNGCGDAGAISQQTIVSGDGYVEFRADPGSHRMIGLSNGNPGTSSGEIKFALWFYPSGSVEVRENGAYKSDWPIAAGDLHRISVESGVVKFYRNGVLKYTSQTTPTYPLLVDTSLEDLNSMIQNAVISGGTGGGGGGGGGTAYITDGAVHAPPTSGSYAYYPTYGVFGPDQSGFPGVGQSFIDPVFGTTIRRLTNELGQHSQSEIYSKNGYFNANGQRAHHRSPSGHQIIDTRTGAVVRSGVAFNSDSSFAPDDPDAWYFMAWGDTRLYKYSISTGASTVLATFPDALGPLGGSVDWIDRTGRYMVLHLGSFLRVYDKQTDTLYAGAIPDSYGGGGGWAGISPDGNYVITSTPPTSSHSWRIDHATLTVSTTPVLFWTLCGGHGDVVSASNGKTYFVSFDCNSTGSVYRVDVSLPQSPSNVQQQLNQNLKLVQLQSWSDVDGHFSRVSTGAMKDWMFISIESGDDGFSSGVGAWRAYEQEIMMANVVTGEVRRLAHHRSRAPQSDYYYQPRVNATWDGSIVLWTSNFGYNGLGYADLYGILNPGQ